MTVRLARSMAAATLAAAVALVALLVQYGLAPGITLDMTRAMPPIVSGIYPPERDPAGMPFAWTSDRVDLRLPGVDRRSPWTLTIVARASRPDAAMFPRLSVTVDGATIGTEQLTNEPAEIELAIPARSASTRGATIAIDVDRTFVPGNGDSRTLGAVVTRIALEPAGRVLPPPRLLTGGLAAAAAFGLAFGLIGLPALAAGGGAALLAIGQATVVTRGLGAYGPYGLDAASMASLIALGTLVLVGLVGQRTRLSQPALAVAAMSAGALYLKLLVLLHPSMPIGDALFHAHRFEWVLEGRYYFTSVAPGLYEFPYPVGFYLLARPLVLFTDGAHQYTALVRIAGTVAQVAAALAIYAMVVRAWGDRVLGATAVAVFHLLPLSMGVLGTGNWTNAFAESVAILALGAIVTVPVGPLAVTDAVGLAAIIALAGLSHTSTFAVLPTSVALAAMLYRWTGDDEARAAAWPVFIAACAATAGAVLLYYGHFGDVYRDQLARITGEVGGAGSENPNTRTMANRLGYVPVLTALYYGWPVVALAAGGVWHLYRLARRDRLSLALAGSAASCAGFLVLGILTPVEMRYFLAALPVVAIVVAAAVVQAAQMQRGVRWTAGLVVAWALTNTVRGWMGWLQ